MTHMTGGCLCGNLRYAADTEPIFSAICRCKCRDPRCFAGSAEDLYEDGDSGEQVINRFCPDCGSTVMIEPAALSNITIIPAGSWLKPTMEIYCDDAQSWVQLGGEMQRFPKMHHTEG
jgi:hypothetical protein